MLFEELKKEAKAQKGGITTARFEILYKKFWLYFESESGIEKKII